MSADVRLAAIAVGCLIAMWALGAYVTRRPLTPLDVESIELRGHGTNVAVMFTRSGYWPSLVAINVVLFVAELAFHDGFVFATVLAVTQLLSQAAAHVSKGIFKRIRPDDWLYHEELGYSFPSGHATTAIVFFGGLLFFVRDAPLPPQFQVVASVVLAIWIAGIPWSRIALAAHYGTDVVGGLLLGAAWLCAMMLLLRHLPAVHIAV